MQFHLSPLFALVSVALGTLCPDGFCEGDGEEAALLQLKARPKVADRCSYRNTTSPADLTCIPNSCCRLYGKTYPCPHSDSNYALCQIVQNPYPYTKLTDETVNLAPELGPYGLGELAGMVGPEKVRFDPAHTYGDVTLPDGQALDAYLLGLPGVKSVELLSKDSDDYMSAFTTDTHGMSALWGDLGEAFQPGFGGLRTYNAVKMQVDSSFKLFHMWSPYWKTDQDFWNPSAKGLFYPCSAWWGAQKTYDSDLLTTSINVATTTEYKAVTQCDMKEFIAIVGQGWNVNQHDCQLRWDCNATGGLHKVSKELHRLKFPFPPLNEVQFILPANAMAERCVTCPLNPANVAASTLNPEDSQKCINVSRSGELVFPPPSKWESAVEDSINQFNVGWSHSSHEFLSGLSDGDKLSMLHR